MTFQVDLIQARQFLRKLFIEKVTESELDWINQQEEKFQTNFQLRTFYLSFSSASRFISKNALYLSTEQLAEAAALRQGFQPQNWNLLQCVRVYLLLMLPNEDAESYNVNLARLQEAADMDEQVTLYSSLPLLPYPNAHKNRTAEGLRTNITDVFDAIALNNSYPAEYLDQRAWNQMVLKAVFMERPLYRIYGAGERANEELADMLIDFAHERWAAGRKVMPELWRFVGPFLHNKRLVDIERVVKGDPLEKEAGLLACGQSELPEAQKLLAQYPEIKSNIESGKLNWKWIGEKSERSDKSSRRQ